MKNWKTIICVVSIIFLVMAVTACHESGAAKSTKLNGRILKNADGNGFYINSGGKTYQIESEEDLSGLVGKWAVLTGNISEKDGKNTITVSEANVL